MEKGGLGLHGERMDSDRSNPEVFSFNSETEMKLRYYFTELASMVRSALWKSLEKGSGDAHRLECHGPGAGRG